MYKRPHMSSPYGGESYRRGPWVRERIMGKGAFGAVLLWQNEETGEQVCIKECHGMELSERQKTQWQKECKIMLRLRHPNVVRGQITPPELDSGIPGIPVLALEYCQAGDLRKVLNKAENSCGLSEIQVRAITRDISLAIEYLHSKNVVHRDLKPENIVLKPLSSSKFQYKLIDLGYAKDVSTDSLCKSFVGTEQYLAPELFVTASYPGKHYNNNVDYWCLGTTVFECIVGFRPFFHGIPAVQWLRHVSDKKAEQICGIINLENDVVFAKNIPTPHHLCRHSTNMLEQWLRLMLLYDADLRGGGMVDGRPVCFNMLEKILKTSILRTYNVTTNRVLSYPVGPDKPLGDIMQAILQDSRIPPTEHEFLSAEGRLLQEDRLAVRCCGPQDEETIVFVVPVLPCQFTYQKRPQPELVQFIMSNSNKGSQIPFDILKRGYSHFLFYVLELNKDYQRLLQAQRALNVYLMTRKQDLTKERNTLSSLLVDLKCRVDFFNESINLDLDRLESLKSSGIYSSKMVTFWNRTKEQVVKFLQLEKDFIQLNRQCEALEGGILDLNKVQHGKNENFGAPWERRIIDIYEKFRRTPKEERGNHANNSDIIKCLVDFITENTRQMQEVYNRMQQILEHKQQVLGLLPHLIQLQNKVLQASDRIRTFQKQRQNDIWGFYQELTNSVDMADGPVPTPNHMGGTSDMPGSTAAALPLVNMPVALTMAHNSGTSGSLRCNSFMVIEKASEESLSLRNESLTSLHQIQQTVSTIQQTLQATVPTPDWSFLTMDQDDSMQE